MTNVLKIKPRADCEVCHGSGEYPEWILFDKGPIKFETCDCVWEQVPENYNGEIEIDLSGMYPDEE